MATVGALVAVVGAVVTGRVVAGSMWRTAAVLAASLRAATAGSVAVVGSAGALADGGAAARVGEAISAVAGALACAELEVVESAGTTIPAESDGMGVRPVYLPRHVVVVRQLRREDVLTGAHADLELARRDRSVRVRDALSADWNAHVDDANARLVDLDVEPCEADGQRLQVTNDLGALFGVDVSASMSGTSRR